MFFNRVGWTISSCHGPNPTTTTTTFFQVPVSSVHYQLIKTGRSTFPHLKRGFIALSRLDHSRARKNLQFSAKITTWKQITIHLKRTQVTIYVLLLLLSLAVKRIAKGLKKGRRIYSPFHAQMNSLSSGWPYDGFID